MNLEHLKQLRKSVADPNASFNMGHPLICLYGHALSLATAQERPLLKRKTPFTNCWNPYLFGMTAFADWLGTDIRTAHDIYCGRWSNHDMDRITRAEALKFLDGLIKQEEDGLYLKIPKVAEKDEVCV